MAPTLLRAATLALRATTATVCPAAPTCPQNNQCAYTANGVSFEVNCATDYYGGDLGLARTTTLAACMKACSTTEGCVAASYVDQNCYMKSKLNTGSANSNVIGVYVTSRPTTPTPPAPASPQICPTSYTCPENNGCTFTGADSRAFTLSCGIDFYGGDLSNFWSQDYKSCTQACANEPKCVAASFTGGEGAGVCYLKDKKNGGSINNSVDAVFMDKSVASSSSAVPSVTTSTSTPVTTSTTSPTPTTLITLTSSSATAAATSTTASSTSSTSTPSATPLLPGPNVVKNPSFESATGNVATNWTSAGNVARQPRPNTNNAQNLVSLNGTSAAGSSVSQSLTYLDTQRSYALQLYYNVQSYSNRISSCSIDIFMSDTLVYSQEINTSNAILNQFAKISATLPKPALPAQTLKIQYKCSGGGASIIFVDDVSLNAV